MKKYQVLTLAASVAACSFLSSCKKDFAPADGAPPSPQIAQAGDMSLVTVDNPRQFTLATARKRSICRTVGDRIGAPRRFARDPGHLPREWPSGGYQGAS